MIDLRPGEPVCTCGHRFVYHGDRALGACDGGYVGKDITRTGVRTLCRCKGWQRARDGGVPSLVPLPGPRP